MLAIIVTEHSSSYATCDQYEPPRGRQTWQGVMLTVWSLETKTKITNTHLTIQAWVQKALAIYPGVSESDRNYK